MIDRVLLADAKRMGWAAQVARCRALPGVGSLTALALVALYHRGELVSAEAFIAFMGMDVRVRESGRWRGWGCFALLKNGTEFNPALRLKACAST